MCHITLQSRTNLKIVIFGDANSINVQRLQQGLTSAGADVDLLSIHIKQSTDDHVYPVVAPLPAGLPSKLRYFTAIPAARKMIAALKPDLLIGYFVTGYGILSAFSNFRPLVQITSGEDVLTSPSNPILRPLIKHNLNRADLVVAWAPHMAEATHSLGIPNEKIFTLPRGIPLDAFKDKRIPRPEKKLPIRIVSTRSLYPIYNYDVEIATMKHLHEQGVDCTLTIVGEGPLRTMLEGLVKETGMEPYIQFAGRVPNDQLANLLIQHDLYFALPVIDGVSASLLEAMAVGLFPIVYDNPANRYWVESGRNGLLVNTLQPDHIANLIRQSIDDLDLRRYSWEHNPPLIFERGDLHRNTAIYLDRFRQVVADYRATKQ